MLTIRNAVSADMPDICRQLTELFQIEHDFSPDLEKQMRGIRMLLDDPRAILLVAEDDQSGIVGHCSVQFLISTASGGLSAVIEDVVVDERFRRKGVGRSLLSEAARLAAARGAVRMQLLCDNSNYPAINFYERLGWKRSCLTNYFGDLA